MSIKYIDSRKMYYIKSNESEVRQVMGQYVKLYKVFGKSSNNEETELGILVDERSSIDILNNYADEVYSIQGISSCRDDIIIVNSKIKCVRLVASMEGLIESNRISLIENSIIESDRLSLKYSVICGCDMKCNNVHISVYGSYVIHNKISNDSGIYSHISIFESIFGCNEMIIENEVDWVSNAELLGIYSGILIKCRSKYMNMIMNGGVSGGSSHK